VHTPSDHPAARVLILNVDGLHAIDLAKWVTEHPQSHLAGLTRQGVTYTNAHTPLGDPAVGLLSLITGGTPISTGIISSDGYDRALTPIGSNCETKGTVIRLSEMIPAGTTVERTSGVLGPGRDCTAPQPHQLLRVNTMFEVVHQKIGRTAWAGDSAWATDVVRGPSGRGLDDSCGFEQGNPRERDQVRVGDLLRWIDAKGCDGAAAQVPALFGMTFASVGAAQSDQHMGYTDALDTPSAGLTESLAFVDSAVGRIVQALKQRHLYDSTWIAVTSAYGHSPMDRRAMRIISPAHLTATVNSVQPGLAAHVCGGRTAMIWLKDSAKVQRVAKAISDHAAELGVQDIYFGDRLALTFNTPAKDPRMPDLILQAAPGVVWETTGSAESKARGGMLDEETHIALLISGSQLTGRSDPTYVPGTQLAPLLLRALGMEKFDLQALHLEHSPALPGIF
jgi:hypothetical protein